MVDERYKQLLDIMDRHGLEMAQSSRQFERDQVRAYRQAAAEVKERIRAIRSRLRDVSIIDREARRRARWRIVRESGLLDDIEGRMSALQGKTSRKLSEGWSDLSNLGRSHSALEVSRITDHVSGGLGLAVNFSELDTAAVELGLGTAVADNLSLTTGLKRQLHQELSAGLAAGQNIRELSGRVDDILGVGADRSEMITRWATVKGYNLSRQAALETALVTVRSLKKQWLAQSDERTCPHCLAQHGTVVEVSQDFDPSNTYASSPPKPHGGFMLVPPLHPRCRCLIVAWDEAFREYTDFSPQQQHEAARELAIEKGFWRALTRGRPQPVPRYGASERLNQAFQIILGQSRASADIKMFRVQGERAWFSIDDSISRTTGGLVQFVVNTSAGLRFARFDVRDMDQARRRIQVLLNELEQGLHADAVLRGERGLRRFGGAVDLVGPRRHLGVSKWRGPPRYQLMSREEMEVLDSVDGFLDRFGGRGARGDLAADVSEMKRSIRSSRSGDVQLQNMEYVRDSFGFWRTARFRGRRALARRRVVRRGRRQVDRLSSGRGRLLGLPGGSEVPPAEAEQVFDHVLGLLESGSLEAEDARLFQIWVADPFKPRRDQALLRLRARMVSRHRPGQPAALKAAEEPFRDVYPELVEESLRPVPAFRERTGGLAVYRGSTEKRLFESRYGDLWMSREVPALSARSGRAELAAMQLGDAAGFDVAPAFVRPDDGHLVQRLFTGDRFELVNPVSQRSPMQHLIAARRSGWEGSSTSLSRSLRAARSPTYRRLSRLRHGSLDFRRLSDDQLQQVKEFMVWDWLAGNLDVDASQFILDKGTGRFIHIDFDRAFQEGFLGRRWSRQVWRDSRFGTNLADFADSTHLYEGLMRQARQRWWYRLPFTADPRSAGRGVALSMPDLQGVLATVEAVDPKVWRGSVDEALDSLQGAFLARQVRGRRLRKVANSPTQAYQNRLTNVRREVSRLFDENGLPSTFRGDLGSSLRGKATKNQLRVMRQLLEGRESVSYPSWSRRVPPARSLWDETVNGSPVTPGGLREVPDVGQELLEDLAPSAASVPPTAASAGVTVDGVSVSDSWAEDFAERAAEVLEGVEGADALDVERLARSTVEDVFNRAASEQDLEWAYVDISVRFRRILADELRIRGIEVDDRLASLLDEEFAMTSFFEEAARFADADARVSDDLADVAAERVREVWREADVEDVLGPDQFRMELRQAVSEALEGSAVVEGRVSTDDVVNRLRRRLQTRLDQAADLSDEAEGLADFLDAWPGQISDVSLVDTDFVSAQVSARLARALEGVFDDVSFLDPLVRESVADSLALLGDAPMLLDDVALRVRRRVEDVLSFSDVSSARLAQVIRALDDEFGRVVRGRAFVEAGVGSSASARVAAAFREAGVVVDDLDALLVRTVGEVFDEIEQGIGGLTLFEDVDRALRRRLDEVLLARGLAEADIARARRILDDRLGVPPPDPAVLAAAEVDRLVERTAGALEVLRDDLILTRAETFPEIRRLATQSLEDLLLARGWTDDVFVANRSRTALLEALDRLESDFEIFFVSDLPSFSDNIEAATKAAAFRFGPEFTPAGLRLRFGLDLADEAEAALFERELFSLFGKRVVFRFGGAPVVGRTSLSENLNNTQELVSALAARLGLSVPAHGVARKRVAGFFGEDRVASTFLSMADENVKPFLEQVAGVIRFSELDKADLTGLQELMVFSWLVGSDRRHLHSVLKNVVSGDVVAADLSATRLGSAVGSIRDYASGVSSERADAIREAVQVRFRSLVEDATTAESREDLGSLLTEIYETLPSPDEDGWVALLHVLEDDALDLRKVLAERDAPFERVAAGEVEGVFELSYEEARRGDLLRYAAVANWGDEVGDRVVFADGSAAIRRADEDGISFWEVDGPDGSAAERVVALATEESLVQAVSAGSALPAILLDAGSDFIRSEFVPVAFVARRRPLRELVVGGQVYNIPKFRRVDPPDVWRQFLVALDSGDLDVDWDDIEPFVTRLEGLDSFKLADDWARLTGGDGSEIVERLANVRASVEDFYESLGVRVRRAPEGPKVDISEEERLAREFASVLGLDSPPVYTGRTSSWMPEPDEGLTRLGMDWRDDVGGWSPDKARDALEIGLWKYLTGTDVLLADQLVVTEGGMSLPTGISRAFRYLNTEVSLDDFLRGSFVNELRNVYTRNEGLVINFDGLAGFLDRVERLDVGEWQRKVRDVFERRARAEGRDLSEAELTWIEAQPDRLRSLRDQVEETFLDWEKSRLRTAEPTEGWVPVWRRLDDVADDVEAPSMVSAQAVQQKKGPAWDALRERLERCRVDIR